MVFYNLNNENEMNSLPMIFLQTLGKVFISIKNWVITLPIALYINSFVDILLINTQYQEVLLPLVIGFITFFVYLIISFFDFLTGIRASSVNKKLITSNRLWRSLFKMVSVLLINSILSIFASIFVILNLHVFSTMLIIILPMIMLTIILFEIHSIGENYEDILGEKPRFFGMIDRMAETLEVGIINKIKNTFK